MKRTKKRRKTNFTKKSAGKSTEILNHSTVVEATDDIYTFNDDDEGDLCVVELPSSTIDTSFTSESDYMIQMTDADKLKSQSAASTATASGKSASKKKRIRRGSGTSSEEERWLSAIESGKLEQIDDELKKIKDPKLMTARQRAMYERNIEHATMPDECAVGSSKEKILSAEAIEKAQLKSQKRKQLADEKREKNKRQTMDRLLKKQDARITKVVKNKIVKVYAPVISYYESTESGAFVSYPDNVEFPIKAQLPRQPPPITLCAICNEEKKRYNCSKTNVPLCSFECYKLNLERQNQ